MGISFSKFSVGFWGRSGGDLDIVITQDYTGKLPRARLTFARPPRCVTGVEVVENVDVNGVGV